MSHSTAATIKSVECVIYVCRIFNLPLDKMEIVARKEIRNFALVFAFRLFVVVVEKFTFDFFHSI